MLWFMLMVAACDPMVIGLEEADTTAPMEWHSRVPECEDDGFLRVDLGAKWQFVQVFLYDRQEDRWSPTDGWEIVDNTLSLGCPSDRYDVRVAWVNLP